MYIRKTCYGYLQVGAAFSFLAVLSKCIDLVAKPSYGFLYRWNTKLAMVCNTIITFITLKLCPGPLLLSFLQPSCSSPPACWFRFFCSYFMFMFYLESMACRLKNRARLMRRKKAKQSNNIKIKN